ncbi:MAG: dTDP-4-dehydrorhamnose 3,5-epimerase [Sedimentisphaerales bacterium]|nr:dTDP-4-dehydrorhamnose 3,5-epimerase [Sedimentisphaerales bacterium]
MRILQTKLPEVLLIEPTAFGDDRGFFLETWNGQRYTEAGLDVDFVQDNVSFSQKGVLRGLHFQHPQAQGKLVQVLAGDVFDVAVDIRIGSKTFGQWIGEKLSVENHRQLYIPPGFAHGFCVLSETALFSYKCTDYYHPQTEGGVLWNDPEVGIDWPVDHPQLSAKDKKYTCLSDIPADRLPRIGEV